MRKIQTIWMHDYQIPCQPRKALSGLDPGMQSKSFRQSRAGVWELNDPLSNGWTLPSSFDDHSIGMVDPEQL